MSSVRFFKINLNIQRMLLLIVGFAAIAAMFETVRAEVNSKPIILSGPSEVSANYGDTVTFVVSAIGEATLTYQWFHDSAPIPDGNAATLTLASVTRASAGAYSVKVSNPYGGTESQPASLIVNLSPVIVAPPQSVLASAHSPISLRAVATGEPPLSYAWQKDGVDIAGANGAELFVGSSDVGDSGDYTLTVSNSNGSTKTTHVRVKVLALVPITQDLVVHLPFDADCNDTSGRGNNGTPRIQPEIVNGGPPECDSSQKAIGAGSIRLQNGQFVALGAPEDLNFGSDVDFSISFWVWAADSTAWTDDPVFVSNKNWQSPENNGFAVAAQGDGWIWNWKGDAGPRRDASPQPTLADWQWHNVIVSHDRTGFAYFYSDGVLRGMTNIANDGDITALGMCIGEDGTGRYGFDDSLAAQFADVRFDDFGIWRRLITPQEAASIYADGKAGEDLTHASGDVIVVAPKIIQGLNSQIVSAGANLALTADVQGTAPFTYEWKVGTNLVGTNALLMLRNVQVAASGDYSLTVSNSTGIATTGATILVSDAQITDALVAHIKFDGDWSDSSGRNNDVTPRGNPQFVQGKFGQAMEFSTDGAAISYASFGDADDLNFGEATDFSVSMWVNWTASVDDLPLISNKDWNSSDKTGWGIFSQNGGNLRINATGAPGESTKMNTVATPNVRDGNWHNVVTTFWRGKAASTYVDGVQANTTPLLTSGSFDAGLETNIGQDGTGMYTDGGAVKMTAAIDDLAIWRRALSAQEVARIVAAAGDLSSLSPAILRFTGARLSNGMLHLEEAGAVAGAMLQQRVSLSPFAKWEDVGPIATEIDLPATGVRVYFRIVNP
jgi:hypothetical protein